MQRRMFITYHKDHYIRVETYNGELDVEYVFTRKVFLAQESKNKSRSFNDINYYFFKKILFIKVYINEKYLILNSDDLRSIT